MQGPARDSSDDPTPPSAVASPPLATPQHTGSSSSLMRHGTSGQHGATARRPLEKAVYGNFQRYYHIRNPTGLDVASSLTDIHPALALDNRVAAILEYLSISQEGAHSIATALDIGCNAGKLTIQLAQTLPRYAHARASGEVQPICVTGVDIDPSLISQAREAVARARSLHRPNQPLNEPHPRAINSAVQPRLPIDAAFFPSVFPLLFGTIPPPHITDADKETARSHSADPAATVAAQLSPPCLDFVAAEWVNLHSSDAQSPFSYDEHELELLQSKDTDGYDVVLALSLTKWVHIQQGDGGLAKLFARIATVLRRGGYLFLERQEWRSYHSAHGLEPGMRAKIRALQLRPDGDFEWMLESLGLVLVDTIGYGTGLGFSRPLQVFVKSKKSAHGEGAFTMAESLMRDSAEGIPWVARSSASNG